MQIQKYKTATLHISNATDKLQHSKQDLIYKDKVDLTNHYSDGVDVLRALDEMIQFRIVKNITDIIEQIQLLCISLLRFD